MINRLSTIFFKGRIKSYICVFPYYGCPITSRKLLCNSLQQSGNIGHNIVGQTSMYNNFQLYTIPENQNYTQRKKSNRKTKNKKIVIYNRKNKLNENKFYLQTKISMKIKIRDKKKFTKNLMEGIFPGCNFPGSNFLGTIYWGTICQRAIFQGEVFRRLFP